MKLVIAAQDIAAITLGLVEGGSVKEEKTIQASPEGYLAALDQTLREWSVTPADIEMVIVVTGPGSFTASRVSTTLANGLGFAWGVPVIGIENPTHLALHQLDLSVLQTSICSAIPTYGRPPEITVAKKMRGDNTGD